MATIISIVSYPFLPARVGGQKGIALFYKYFGRYHQVVLVTTEKNDPSAAEGYEVLNILSNSPLRYVNPFYFFTIRKLIRQRGASHLILEHPYYAWLGVLLQRVCKVKLVVHSHNIESLRWKNLGKWWWKILWRYEKWCHRQADYNFFIQDADKAYAISHFALDPARCITMSYGLEKDTIPTGEEREAASRQLRQQYGIAADEKILLFNGAFSYPPNLDALMSILDKINPLLLKKEAFRYKILLCGKDIPSSLTENHYPHVIFAGFVEDIDLYFKGADIFLNPITKGGGIKTKLVEALGNDLTSVSVRNGAIGIDPAWCNGKLLISEDDDWSTFTELILEAAAVKAHTPTLYFDQFYWVTTTKRAAGFIR